MNSNSKRNSRVVFHGLKLSFAVDSRGRRSFAGAGKERA
jgi:hypothetical protein